LVLRKAFFTQMILEGETASSSPVSATPSAKKEIIQTRWTIIIPHMIGMRLCTGALFTGEIKTEIFPATMTEFKEVRVQDSTADFTVMSLHPLYVRGLRQEVRGLRVNPSTCSRQSVFASIL
jgi:hypothetical protein